ncbi:MAG: hypothetical protein KIT48_19520 [Pseudolabrys sp.]|nr:hypothetical protein [Pseudolabrys sp.]
MNTPFAKHGLRQNQFAALMQMSVDEVRSLMNSMPSLASQTSVAMARLSGAGVRYSYREALAIEAARQLTDDGGLSMESAMRIVISNIGRYFEYRCSDSGKTDSDFWIGVTRARNTWDQAKEPRGSYPVTSFGPGEFWSGNHYAGALAEVLTTTQEWQRHDEQMYPESDPAAIFLTNISAADRRLRQRAGDLIEVDADEFTAT